MWLLSTFILYISIDIVKSSVDYLQHPVKSCHIGDAVQNECNKCLCTSKTMFECTPLDCNKNKTGNEFEVTKQLCYPNQLYVQNLITCICTKDGRWPHKSCQETFQSLPPSNVVRHKCEPDTYVPIDCNVCRCGPDGEMTDRCTRNGCDDEGNRRANLRSNNVYTNCDEKNWYSLSPCQFCFCVKKNKLVCNTAKYISKNLELGSYNLRTCGKDMIREAIKLIPENILRTGFAFDNSSTTTTQKPTRETTKSGLGNVRDDNNVVVVNRESNEGKPTFETTELNNFSSSNENYFDPEDEPQKKLTITKTKTDASATLQTNPNGLSNTNIPFQKSDEAVYESELKSDEDNGQDSRGMEVKKADTATDNAPQNSSDVIRLSAKEANTEGSYQYVSNTLKINLPKVLNKVFELALRKSMVSLSKKTNCTPGTTVAKECNMCFCLKNSKLLCTTNNRCTNKKKT